MLFMSFLFRYKRTFFLLLESWSAGYMPSSLFRSVKCSLWYCTCFQYW